MLRNILICCSEILSTTERNAPNLWSSSNSSAISLAISSLSLYLHLFCPVYSFSRLFLEYLTPESVLFSISFFSFPESSGSKELRIPFSFRDSFILLLISLISLSFSSAYFYYFLSRVPHIPFATSSINVI